MMKIIKIDEPGARELTLQTWRAGGLVIAPTETVYGAMVDCENQEAVEKLLAYKRRPAGKALAVAGAGGGGAEKYVEINEQAEKIYREFLPGPVTVVSRSRGRVGVGVESESGSLGIRIPDYQWLLEVLEEFGRGVTATSANSSGKRAPYKIADLFANLSGRQRGMIDLIVDAGELEKNPPSVVIDTTAEAPMVLRDEAGVWREREIGGAGESDDGRGSGEEVGGSGGGGEIMIAKNEEETRKLGEGLAEKYFGEILEKGLVITLDGAMGAGKTTLTQGIAKGLQVEGPVKSPTYVFMREYECNWGELEGKLYHLDAWRIDDQETWESLGVEGLVGAGVVVIIEWYEKVREFFAPKGNWLEIAVREKVEELGREIWVKK